MLSKEEQPIPWGFEGETPPPLPRALPGRRVLEVRDEGEWTVIQFEGGVRVMFRGSLTVWDEKPN